jgi:disulfide bond formation protein DsbB
MGSLLLELSVSLQIPCTFCWSFWFVVMLVVAGGGTFLRISDISQGLAVVAAILECAKAVEGEVGCRAFIYPEGN